jgi:ribosomal protein S18 acetylase RimI-like enzyme
LTGFEGAPDVAIRPARAADVPAIARVKVAGWRTAYGPVIEPQVLEPFLDEARQAAGTAAALDDPRNVVLVAARGDEVVGFAVCLVPHDGEPLLDSLHVESAERSRGIGRRLVHALGFG